MVEQIIEVDEHDKIIGLRSRNDFYMGKHIHRAAHLILFNSKNQVLLQKRSSSKRLYPNLFTYSVDGTVADESYELCIQREMKEEIGISITVKRLFTYPFFDKSDKAWHCVFIGKTDEKLTPDAKEIQKIVWVDADKLKEEIIKDPAKYVPPFIEGMKLFFSEYYDKLKKSDII